MASDPVAKVNRAAGPPVNQASTPPKAAAQPMPIGARGAIYTVTAAKGANAADLVNAGMISKLVGKATPRRVMVAAPDGPSTSGGKHARQTITLVPVSGQGVSIMCGWLDVAQKAASLRDYRALSEHHHARTGKTLDVTADEYLAIIHDLENLLRALQVNVTHDTSDAVQKAAQVAQNIEDSEPEVEPTKPAFVVAAGVAMFIAAVISIVLLLR